MALSEQEREMQLSRVRQLVESANRNVWSVDGYPEVHRPDIEGMMSRIRIESEVPFDVHKPHPHLKPEWIRKIQMAQRAEREDSAKKIAIYEPFSRIITLSDKAVGLSDPILRRIVTHELATDLYNRLTYVYPSEYESAMRAQVKESLSELFLKKQRPRLEDTRIAIEGERAAILVGDLYISDIYEVDNNGLSEVYPTMVELVTDQVMISQDIRKFDQDIANRSVVLPRYEDHPKFAAAFFGVASVVDWRTQLDAFRKVNPPDIVTVISGSDEREKGLSRVNRLVSAMHEDEARMSAAARG